MVLNPFVQQIDNKIGDKPPPPELPKFDPNEDGPKWSWTRMNWNLPVDKGPIQWTPIGTQPKSPDDPDWRGVIRNKVIEYPMPEEYKFGKPTPKTYFWFDTPDYADPFKKMWFSFKAFLWSGSGLAFVKWNLDGGQPHLSGYLKAARVCWVPWVIAGLAGSATVVTLANLRGKIDDQYNYLVGGFVFGSILGRKDYRYWVRYNVVFIPFAIFLKYNAEINGVFMTRMPYRGTFWNMYGSDAEHGIKSGDFRFGIRGTYGEPGRDVRKPY